MLLRRKQETRPASGFNVFPDSALNDLVETWFLAFFDVQLAATGAPATAYYIKVYARAKAFVDEHRLGRWVLDQKHQQRFSPVHQGT